MLTGIDHIVIAVPDLPTAVRDYGALGFTVLKGGRHPVGTYNALISLADGAYIEIIAFYEPNPNHRWWQPLLNGGGLVDFCMQTDDLAGDTVAFRNAGVDIADPVPQSRQRPDGHELQWVFSLARGPHRGVAPFIIKDVTPRDERVPREIVHPNGVTGIASLTIVVNDLEEVRHWYASTVRQGGEEISREDLDAVGLSFTAGPHVLEFVSPRRSRHIHGPVALIQEWLGIHGPSPYSATLRTLGGQRGRLDFTMSHNAQLFLV